MRFAEARAWRPSSALPAAVQRNAPLADALDATMAAARAIQLLADRVSGHIDPGADAVVIWLDACRDASATRPPDQH